MALIVMAVHDTVENNRTQYTRRTLYSLQETVNFAVHRMVIVDNGSCEATKKFLHLMTGGGTTVITNKTNVGTANAVNQGLRLRVPNEYVIKMDNDVVIHTQQWVEVMQDVMQRMPTIGILGLKRVDLLETPYSINPLQRSRLLMVPQTIGQRWRIVEECKHIMGTCTMLAPALLDRIGYFYQMGSLYGFDDSLMCVRSKCAGFINCFLPHIDIDHIDTGSAVDYIKWKEGVAHNVLSLYAAEEAAYYNGVKDVYYDGIV